MAETKLSPPKAAKVIDTDGSGHYWCIQQGDEFWYEQNAGRPNLEVAVGEKQKKNRGAALDGSVFDRLAERMMTIEKLKPRK